MTLKNWISYRSDDIYTQQQTARVVMGRRIMLLRSLLAKVLAIPLLTGFSFIKNLLHFGFTFFFSFFEISDFLFSGDFGRASAIFERCLHGKIVKLKLFNPVIQQKMIHDF